jgi:hypothetical protein
MTNEWDRGISLKAGASGPATAMPVALVASINTTDCYGINVNWIGEAITDLVFTVEILQLYYRVGNSSAWKAVDGASFIQDDPVFVAPESFISKLPAETNNQPDVQLLWYIYSTDNGLAMSPSDRIAVYGVVVNPDSIANNPKEKYCYASGLGCDGINHPTDTNVFNDFNYIDRVTVLSELFTVYNNPSGCDIYGNFTEDIIDVEIGSTYQIEVTPYFNYDFGTTAIWVDWNDDGDFEDNNESLGVQSGIVGVFSLTPDGIEGSGRRRMRIRYAKTENPLACGTQGYGEVEDYTLNIIQSDLTPKPDCAAYKTPVQNDINLCTGSQTFTWNPATGNATGYTFYLGTDSLPTNVHNNNDRGADTSFVNTTPLSANTTYFWRVVPYNILGNTATSCDVFKFTTSPNLDPTIDLFLMDGQTQTNDSASVCSGQPITLDVTTSNGTAPISYGWTGDDQYVDNNASNNTFFMADTANRVYNLNFTVKDGNNCRVQQAAKIFVKENPTLGTLTADKSSVCPGENVTITLSGHTDIVDDWEKAEGTGSYGSINHNTDVLTTTITDSTRFRVLLSNAGGCQAPVDTVTVELKAAPAAPTIMVNPANNACVGDVITLTSSETSNIVWNDAAASTSATINVTTNGSYKVTFTDPTTTCSSESVAETITFNALPVPIITIVGLLCDGETVSLSTQFSGVSWDLDGNGTSTDDMIDVTADGVYTVTYTNPTTNCSGSASETITFNALPVPIITIGGLLCDGETVSLSTQYSGVSWDLDGNGTSTDDMIDVTAEGVYTVTYTNPTTNCSGSASETVNFNSLPDQPTVTVTGLNCPGNMLTLSTQYTTVTWDLDDVVQTSETYNIIADGKVLVTYENPSTKCKNSTTENVSFNSKPLPPTIKQKGDSLVTEPIQTVDWLDDAGNVIHTGETYKPSRTPGQTFTAKVISNDNCESDESNTVIYDHTISILEHNAAQFWSVYPNPAANELHISVTSNEAVGKYQLQDMSGRVIELFVLKEGKTTISLSSLESGVYLLKHEKSTAVRVVKQ